MSWSLTLKKRWTSTTSRKKMGVFWKMGVNLRLGLRVWRLVYLKNWNGPRRLDKYLESSVAGIQTLLFFFCSNSSSSKTLNVVYWLMFWFRLLNCLPCNIDYYYDLILLSVSNFLKWTLFTLLAKTVCKIEDNFNYWINLVFSSSEAK